MIKSIFLSISLYVSCFSTCAAMEVVAVQQPGETAGTQVWPTAEVVKSLIRDALLEVLSDGSTFLIRRLIESLDEEDLTKHFKEVVKEFHLKMKLQLLDRLKKQPDSLLTTEKVIGFFLSPLTI